MVQLNSLRSVIVNTFEIQGGAAKAAYRLHKGLRTMGVDNWFLSQQKTSSDPNVIRIDASSLEKHIDSNYLLGEFLQHRYINKNRSKVSNTLFTLPYPGLDLTPLERVRQASVINLHWVAMNQSVATINKLLSLGKPVVWTLHDQWPFTGGCHYSAGCLEYEKECWNCLQLLDDPHHLPSAVLRDKLKLWGQGNINIVTPSQWLAGCVRKSALFRNSRVEVIPNSLETEVFVPVNKGEAKRKLGLSEDVSVLLFGAYTAEERRKGFTELMEAVKLCIQDDAFQKILQSRGLHLLTFGKPAKLLEKAGIPMTTLGNINSEKKLSEIYSAADIFVLPSLEDNLPNTVIEAMSCGTPTLAFNVGGISEMVHEGKTGRLAPVGDSRALSAALISMLSAPDELTAMSKICRETAVKNYSIPVQARRYIALFQELTGDSPVPVSPQDIQNSESVRAKMNVSLGPNVTIIYQRIKASLQQTDESTLLEKTKSSWIMQRLYAYRNHPILAPLRFAYRQKKRFEKYKQ